MSKKLYDNAIYFKISSEMKEELERVAKENETTVGQTIRQAIKSYISPAIQVLEKQKSV